jgi:hypothetical protein
MNRRSMVRPPERYSDSLSEFAARFVEPNLLDPELVAYYHRLLVDYASGADPLFLLRMVSGTERRNVYRTQDGTRFRATDNAPSWWMHHLLFHGQRLTSTEFALAIDRAPAHLFDVARAIPESISAHGWHVAHIFGVKTGDTDYTRWRRSDVRARFLRNIHPCNYFFVATTGWQRWGGNERVIGYFADLFARRYHDVWSEFVGFANADPGTLVRVVGDVHYEYEPVGLPEAKPKVVRGATAATSTHGVVSYSATRLLFKAAVIEALDPEQRFRVETPVGTFELTKADFYRVFRNVVQSASYRDHGIYHYSTLPRKALEFRVGDIDEHEST